MLFVLCLLAVLLLATAPASSFAPSIIIVGGHGVTTSARRTGYATSTTQQQIMISPDLLDSVLLIATIDSDIASISENEFGKVFAGGIVVMFGGLFSALAVGFIIDSRNLYANIVADSYVQGADDEEFWKNLSDEEKKKTQELLQKLKGSNEGGASQKELKMEPIATIASSQTRPQPEIRKATAPEPAKAAPNEENKQVGMFSDYGEE
jgi:hypothetical protein